MTVNHGTRPATSNQSTEKALAIIEFLAEQQKPVRLVEISEALHTNSSTTFRFLSALQTCGYVSQDATTTKYYLTFKICRLANTFSSRLEFQAITHPYLVELSNYVQESSCISVERDMMMVYIDVMSGPGKTLMSMQRVGNTSPMHSTGNGKLLMLDFTERMIDELIQTRGLPKFTENTIVDKETLLCRLDQIRKDGYAFDNEENELGLRCLAYPIYDYTGKIIAGISITGPTSRLTDEFIGEKQDFLKTTAQHISRDLGYLEKTSGR